MQYTYPENRRDGTVVKNELDGVESSVPVHRIISLYC